MPLYSHDDFNRFILLSLYHRYINAHSPVVKHSDRKGHLGKSPRYDWDSYKSHAEMNAWIDSIAADNSFAEIVNIGQSAEGRDMNVLEIRKAGNGKPTIFIEAGEKKTLNAFFRLNANINAVRLPLLNGATVTSSDFFRGEGY